jgi:hypothetical protein
MAANTSEGVSFRPVVGKDQPEAAQYFFPDRFCVAHPAIGHRLEQVGLAPDHKRRHERCSDAFVAAANGVADKMNEAF